MVKVIRLVYISVVYLIIDVSLTKKNNPTDRSKISYKSVLSQF